MADPESDEFQRALSSELDRYIEWAQALEAKAIANKTFPNASKWFYGDLIHVYTRSTVTHRGMAGHRVLCLATVEVDESLQGRGIFTALLDRLSSRSDRFEAQLIGVESVLNPRLAAHLERIGFVVCANDEGSPSFVRSFSGEPVAGSKPKLQLGTRR
jgi:GNAT superfamily N-acetyltransferase